MVFQTFVACMVSTTKHEVGFHAFIYCYGGYGNVIGMGDIHWVSSQCFSYGFCPSGDQPFVIRNVSTLLNVCIPDALEHFLVSFI